jgi:hypothetical protein
LQGPTFVRSASAAPCQKTGGLNRNNKSAFHPEGKMNKAGSCTAAMKEKQKGRRMAGPFAWYP